MARQVSEIQQHEIEAYAKFAAEHGIINDDSEDDRANAELLLNYFLNTWPNVISHQTLTQAFPALKSHLKFKSAARLEAEKVARENSTIARKFADWFDSQNLIVKQGDDGYRNFAFLLTELRGRDVNETTLHQAMSRLNYGVGRQLIYVSRPKKEVDPSYRPGRFVEDYNKTPVDYEHERQAAYADQQESTATISKREQAGAKSEAESIRSGYSHAEDDQISRLFCSEK